MPKTNVSKLLLSSKNLHKINELKEFLAPLNISVVSALDYDLPDVPETESTFKGNAKLKAISGLLHTNLPTLADDSGLCVDILNGAPGVLSARYSQNGDNISKLLQELKNTSNIKDRTAHFVCHLCLALPQENQKEPQFFHFEGTANGFIDFAPSGNRGFGYDPIFKPHTDSQTWAELPPHIKQKSSHRSQAMNLLKNFLES